MEDGIQSDKNCKYLSFNGQIEKQNDNVILCNLITDIIYVKNEIY